MTGTDFSGAPPPNPRSRTIPELIEDLKTEPVRLLSGRTVSVEDARRINDVDPILERFGTWVVTEYGLECLTVHYAVEKRRLRETDWLDHMIHKTWVVAYDFSDALTAARDRFWPRPAVSLAPKAERPTTPGVARRPRRQSLSNRLRFLVLKRDHYACQICGRTAAQGYQIQVDHKLARAKGGSDQLDNLQALCSLCNNGKGTEDL